MPWQSDIPMVIYCRMKRGEERHGGVTAGFHGLAVSGY